MALNSLGNSISTPPICMSKDLLQSFDDNGNPIYKDLKRFNYKDRSNFQWSFACLYDDGNDTITILKMMPAIFVRESLADKLNVIVEHTISQFVHRKTLFKDNNTKTQNNMKRKIRLTEGDLHRIVKKCLNESMGTNYNIGDLRKDIVSKLGKLVTFLWMWDCGLIKYVYQNEKEDNRGNN